MRSCTSLLGSTVALRLALDLCVPSLSKGMTEVSQHAIKATEATALSCCQYPTAHGASVAHVDQVFLHRQLSQLIVYAASQRCTCCTMAARCIAAALDLAETCRLGWLDKCV
jgi:hypothetical protein